MRGLADRERLVLGLGGIVLVTACLVVGIRGALGEFTPGYPLTVQFDRAGQGLDRFSDVRVRGVTVGSVQEIRLNEANLVEVDLRMDPDVQVPETATAAIEASSVFGPRFITIDLGPDELDGPYMAAGSLIPTSATFEPTGIEAMLDRTNELLGAVDGQQLISLVTNLAGVWRDQGGRLGNTIDASDVISQSLDDSRDDFRRLVGSTDRLTTAFRDRGPQLVALIRDANETLAQLRALDPHFTESLDALHGFSSETARFLDANDELFQDALAALVDGVLPALQALGSDVRNIPLFADTVSVFADVLTSMMHIVRPGGLVGGLEALTQVDPCQVLPALPCGETP